MRSVKLLLVPIVAALLLGGGHVESGPRTARLRIVAPATMEFRTLGLPLGAFTGPHTFNRLQPGRYVVVQAPPVPGVLQVSCTNGQTMQQDLVAGDDVTCTFSIVSG